MCVALVDRLVRLKKAAQVASFSVHPVGMRVLVVSSSETLEALHLYEVPGLRDEG